MSNFGPDFDPEINLIAVYPPRTKSMAGWPLHFRYIEDKLFYFHNGGARKGADRAEYKNEDCAARQCAAYNKHTGISLVPQVSKNKYGKEVWCMMLPESFFEGRTKGKFIYRIFKKDLQKVGH